jgi:hypothetical protein
MTYHGTESHQPLTRCTILGDSVCCLSCRAETVFGCMSVRFSRPLCWFYRCPKCGDTIFSCLGDERKIEEEE